MKNAHAVLGVSANATAEDLRKAYKSLALRHHPDKHQGSQAAKERMASIIEAYGYLTALTSPEAQSTKQEGQHSRTADQAVYPDQERSTPFRRPPPRGASSIHADAAAMDREAEAARLRAAMTGKDPFAAAQAASIREMRHREANRSEMENRALDREQRIKDEALRRTRDNLRAQPYARSFGADNLPDLQGNPESIFSRSRRVSEFVMTDAQTKAMEEALTSLAQTEAKQAVMRHRSGSPEAARETPALHMAQKIGFEGRTVSIQLGSRGKIGRNIVAIPDLVQTDPGTIKQERSFRLVELLLDRDGKQSFSGDEGLGLVKGGQCLKLNLEFSEQRENLREAAKAKRVAR